MASGSDLPKEPCSYECRRCNIVLLGELGHGKSSLGNAILRHKAFKVDSSINFKRVTVAVSGEERAIVSPDNIVYSVKVVDTIGFSDPKTKDAATLREIKTFFRTKVVEGVSLVLFVMKAGEAAMSGEMVQMYEKFVKSFRDISSMTALVLTHCEDLTDKSREEQVRTFTNDKHKSIVAEFAKKGIFTVGFPDVAAMKELDEEARSMYEESMEEDVQKLHNLVFKSTTMTLTSEMFYGDKFWERLRPSGCSII